MKYISQLKSILKASGWSQEVLAGKLGVSFATLNAWINGRAAPRKKALANIELLFIDILGSEQINFKLLNSQKKSANKLMCRAKNIIDNSEAFNSLILQLTYNSNTIEGSTMTLADTRAVLFNHATLINRTQIEQIEAQNHQSALVWVLSELQKSKFAIDEQFIVGLHLRLMNGIISNAGQYRDHSVRILGSRTTVANFRKIPELINQFTDDLISKDIDMVSKLAYSHAQFEKIHPFSDGNGRIGRLVMLAMALNGHNIPPIVLKEKKYAYYKYLELAQTKDKYDSLEMFIAESMISANQILFG
jgi:Fic family protein/DNA-binding XRE family transcriptional regulator